MNAVFPVMLSSVLMFEPLVETPFAALLAVLCRRPRRATHPRTARTHIQLNSRDATSPAPARMSFMRLAGHTPQG